MKKSLIILIIVMITLIIQMIFNMFITKIDVTDKVKNVLMKSILNSELKQKLLDDKTFKVYIKQTTDIDKAGSFNKFTNTITLYLHKEFFESISTEPGYLEVFLDYKVPVILHELIHYYLNDNKLRKEIFNELFVILDNEKDIDLAKNRDVISKRKHFLVKNYLQDKYTLEYVYSEKGRKNEKILRNFYEEIITFYYMNGNVKGLYPEIENKLFR